METILRVRCACGWERLGTEDDVVAATSDHGRRLHNMDATREQVLAMATPVEATSRTLGGDAPTETS